jgi:Ca-activated chloride channel family protein
MTEMTKGYRTYVLEDEDIEIKVSDFYEKVSSPVLTDLKISFDKKVSISEVYNKEIPDLFKGSNVSLLGRYNGSGKSIVTLQGKINSVAQTYQFEVVFEESQDKFNFIPGLWASRAVGYLLDQIRLHGESKELKDEVVRLAKKHGIITPYTSYLILEDEAISSRNNIIRPSDQILRPRTLEAPQIQLELNLDDVKNTVVSKEESKKQV